MFFCGMATLLIRQSVSVLSRRRAYISVCSRPVPIAVEDCETAAAELRSAQPSSGGVAEPPVELCHCVCSKLLVLDRKVFPIAAYLAAAHFERFGIAHITWVQDV
jgi:hypothetical protein